MIDWRDAALILSTLFLNLPFWLAHDFDLPLFDPVSVHGVILGVAAQLIATVFFMGPALAAQRARKPLAGLLEDSFGSIPAWGLRLCCVVFLVLWLGYSPLGLLWRFMPFVVHHIPSDMEATAVTAAVGLFLFATSLQSLRTNAKLAVFTNKLAIAILIAALLRVREGWPAVLNGLPIPGERSGRLDAWHGFSLLVFGVAPLALFAATFGSRIGGRKQVVKTALSGVALPVFGSLLVAGIIDAAALRSASYTPSLSPNIMMALWSHSASGARGGTMMLTVIATFGAGRFGARSLIEAVSIPGVGTAAKWAVLGCCLCFIAWIPTHYFPTLATAFEASATCLTVAGAILTADLITGRRQTAGARKIDWVGLSALAAGLAMPFYMPFLTSSEAPELWWHPWLLPSFGVGFVTCLVGGLLQKRMAKAVTIES